MLQASVSNTKGGLKLQVILISLFLLILIGMTLVATGVIRLFPDKNPPCASFQGKCLPSCEGNVDYPAILESGTCPSGQTCCVKVHTQ